jgi:glycosyltransferase involved in cell wall biosynthesis
MRVLVVCSGNSGKVSPFILEQAEALMGLGVEIDFFLINKKGILGYLHERKKLLFKIYQFSPDLIHSHYGLSGLFSCLQQNVPVISTYHGSDINNRGVFLFSLISILLSKKNIFVSERIYLKAFTFYKLIGFKRFFTKKSIIIPCGVDLELFCSIEKNDARLKLGLDIEKKYVLFAGSFDNRVKNAPLARNVIELLNNVELLELKFYTRLQVVYLLNAVDCLLMTSLSEGSPQIVKEALSCGCPIVSVDVGDVKELILGLEECAVCSYEPKEISIKLNSILRNGIRINGRDLLERREMGLRQVAQRIIKLYN